MIDGRSYEVEVSEPEPGVYLLKNGGFISEAVVSQPAKPGDPTQIAVGGNEFEIRLFDPRRLRSAADTDEHAAGVAEIKTAMPGKVVRLLLEAGSEVEKGEGVIVVEAMKMQNEMKSAEKGSHVRAIFGCRGRHGSAGECPCRALSSYLLPSASSNIFANSL